MYPLKVIGLGPGHPDYILPIATKEIAEAELISWRPSLRDIPKRQRP